MESHRNSLVTPAAWRDSLNKLGLMFASCYMVSFLPPSAYAQFYYQESFTDNEAFGWSLGTESGGFTPILTGDGSTDPVGDGWLRLNTNGGNQSNFAYLALDIPSVNNDITVGFDYAFYNSTSSGADGISFFMYDASVPFDAGAFGGSLGYANRTGVDGVAGGFVGIALDNFGNFSNPTEGRNGGVGSRRNTVAVRGPGNGQTGYQYLGGTGDTNIPDLIDQMDFPNQSTRPDQTGADFRRFEVTVRSDNTITGYMQFGVSGTMDELFTLNIEDVFPTGYTRPDNIRIGFAGSTGGVNEFHEIRNLQIETSSQPIGTILWDNDSNDSLWGTDINWERDLVPDPGSDIFFENTYVSTNQTVDVQTSRIIRSLSFDAPFDYTLNNSTLQFQDLDNIGPETVAINVSDRNGTGTFTVNSNIQLEQDLRITNMAASSLLNLNGTINAQGNDITVNGNGTVDINGNITGTGTSLLMDSMDGTGILELNGDNTFGGGLTVNSGTVRTTESSSIYFGSNTNNTPLGTGDITVQNGSTLQVSTTGGGDIFQTGSSLTLTNGTLDFYSNDNMSFDGGNINISNGTADFDANDNLDLNNTVNISGGATSFTTNGNHLDIESGGAINVSGGTLNLSKNGGGNSDVRLDGDIAITGGTVNISSTDDINIRNGATITQNNAGSTLTFTSSDDAQIVGNSSVTITAGDVDIDTGSADGNRFYIESGSSWTQNAGTTTVDGGEADLRGTVTIYGNSTLLQVNSGVGNADDARLQGTFNITDGGQITIASNTTIAGATLNGGTSTTKGTLTIGGNVTNSGTITINNTPNLVLNPTSGTAVVSGSDFGSLTNTLGTFTKTNGGTVRLDTEVFSNEVVVDQGTLLLGNNEQLEGTSNVTLGGGTLATGGFDETVGTLTLSSTSTIDLGSGDSVLAFDDSSSLTWGGSLNILNWSGSSSGGGTDQLFIGTDVNGVTTGQLAQIFFINPEGFAPGTYAADILSTGEIVVVIPEPSTVIAIIGLVGIVSWRERKRFHQWMKNKFPSFEADPKTIS